MNAPDSSGALPPDPFPEEHETEQELPPAIPAGSAQAYFAEAIDELRRAVDHAEGVGQALARQLDNTAAGGAR